MSSIGPVSWSAQTLVDIALQQQAARAAIDTKILDTALDIQEQLGNELASLIAPIDLVGQNLDVIG